VLVPGLTPLSGLLSTMEQPVDGLVWPPTVTPAATSSRVIAKRPHRNQIAVLKQPPTRSTRGSRSVALVFNRSLQSKSICIKWVGLGRHADMLLAATIGTNRACRPNQGADGVDANRSPVGKRGRRAESAPLPCAGQRFGTQQVARLQFCCLAM
jgi:hypothetical protein